MDTTLPNIMFLTLRSMRKRVGIICSNVSCYIDNVDSTTLCFIGDRQDSIIVLEKFDDITFKLRKSGIDTAGRRMRKIDC